MLSLLALALAPQVGDPGAGSEPAIAHEGRRRPNIVLILADDFGVDLVRVYGEGAGPPCTPSIDSLATDGLLFRNAWANPVCSPTRAALLTGRHGFRTGIGTPGGGGGMLGLTEITLPEMLSGYESACTGKWHLGANDPEHPNLSGFQYFAGSLGGGIVDYEFWTKVVNGEAYLSHTYATQDTANEAIAKIQTMQEPWFLYVPFVAPHVPFHEPPSEACPTPACVDSYCSDLRQYPSEAQLAKAMTEAMDAEIGRILETLDALARDTFVFFMGDNGTAGAATEHPFDPERAKGTPYENGVNVPLLVRGPGVVQGECQALVGATDIFATFAQLAGVNAAAEDSVSMVPYFSNPNLSLRETVYTEQFTPNNSSPPYNTHDRAIRNERYKLIRRIDQPDEFYDLSADPFELTNRLDIGLSLSEREVFSALTAELAALGVD